MANDDKRLFDYIHGVGERWDFNGMYVFDNTGPNADGGNSYKCFLKGGISFEIQREKVDQGWEYWLDITWAGAFEASDSADIIAMLVMLEHELPELKKEVT